MKKKISVLLALLTLCIGGAWATVTPTYFQGSQVTTASGLVDGNKYVLRVTGGSYITEANSRYEAPQAQNTITAAAVFTFHADGTSWKVENESTGNYWGTLTGSAASGTFLPATAATAGTWTFTFNSNNVNAQSGSYYINRSSGVMHGWNSAINLQIYNVDKANLVTGIGDLQNDKAYYITTYDRGAWFVPSGGTAITSTTKAGFAASQSDVKQQFAFLTYGTTGVYHLYSISEKKFVSKSGNYTTLTSAVGDNVTLLASSGNANFPFVVALNNGQNHMGISNGYNPAVITSWNSLTDDGNRAQIREVADFDPTEAMAALEEVYGTTVKVTYELYEADGTTLVTSVDVIQQKNSDVEVPTTFPNFSYFTYDTQGTIGTTDCTIKVTRTLSDNTIVYPISNLEADRCYYIRTRNSQRGALSTYTDDGTTYLASPVKSALNISEKKFAFVTYEDNTYLYSVDDEMFVTFQGTQDKAPLAEVFSSTSDAISFSLTSAPLYTLRFNNDSNKNINSSVNYTYGVVINYWGSSSNQWDDGCLYTIEDAGDFDSDEVITRLNEYFHGQTAFLEAIATLESYNYGTAYGQYSLTGSYAGQEAQAASMIASLKAEGYSAANMATAEALLAATVLNTPAAGYYRIKNVATGKYLRTDKATWWNSQEKGVYANGTANSVETVINLIQKSDGIYMYNQGYGFAWVDAEKTQGYGLVWVSNNPDKYVNWFPGTTAGQLAFAICYGNGVGGYASYLLKGIYTADTDEAVIGGTDLTAEAAQWIVEPATSATVTLNGPVDGSYYATLCVPFACTVSGATAYTLSLNTDETGLSFSEGSTTISGGVPVLLKGTSATATLTIASNAAYADANNISTSTALTGIYPKIDVTGATDYFLGVADSKVGFYHWDGTTLAANRAYFKASKLSGGSGVKGLVLDFEDDATGISNLNVNDNLNGAIYNLAGQRISKMQKGINIVNGKKILK